MVLLLLTSTYRRACSDHLVWLQLRHPQLFDITMVQPNARSEYALLGLCLMVHRTVPISNL